MEEERRPQGNQMTQVCLVKMQQNEIVVVVVVVVIVAVVLLV